MTVVNEEENNFESKLNLVIAENEKMELTYIIIIIIIAAIEVILVVLLSFMENS